MIQAIVTDIEGTTTSVAFVYDVLFPYFSEKLAELPKLKDQPEVAACFESIKAQLSKGAHADPSDSDVLQQLQEWIDADKKETALKTLQGIVWKHAYEQGEIKGHVYDDVPGALKQWQQEGITLAVYSSGSVAAQKLLFSYSEHGDLSPCFTYYFDTNIGHKRESASYRNIQQTLELPADTILFLSDIEAELDAAREAGFQTLQLLRPGNEKSQRHPGVENFSTIDLRPYESTPKSTAE